MCVCVNITATMDDSLFAKDEIYDVSGEALEHIDSDIPVNTKSAYFVNCRLKRISNIAHLVGLQNLCFRKNLIMKMECFATLTSLLALDMYDNKIEKIEDLENCLQLTYLDLSFNVIERIENLSQLERLEKLFLIENRLKELPPAAQFAERHTRLEQLELGGNQFRSLCNFVMPSLTHLWLGKNKITTLSGTMLANLRVLSLQSNRIVSFAELGTFPLLEELYLSHNGLSNFDGFAASSSQTLRILDVGTNRITTLESMPTFAKLDEFWFNNNKLENFQAIDCLAKKIPTVSSLYAEGNGFSSHPQYRARILMILPSVTELDSTPLTKPAWLVDSSSTSTATNATAVNNDANNGTSTNSNSS